MPVLVMSFGLLDAGTIDGVDGPPGVYFFLLACVRS